MPLMKTIAAVTLFVAGACTGYLANEYDYSKARMDNFAKVESCCKGVGVTKYLLESMAASASLALKEGESTGGALTPSATERVISAWRNALEVSPAPDAAAWAAEATTGLHAKAQNILAAQHGPSKEEVLKLSETYLAAQPITAVSLSDAQKDQLNRLLAASPALVQALRDEYTGLTAKHYAQGVGASEVTQALLGSFRSSLDKLTLCLRHPDAGLSESQKGAGPLACLKSV